MSTLTAVQSGNWNDVHTWGDSDTECGRDISFDASGEWTVNGTNCTISGGFITWTASGANGGRTRTLSTTAGIDRIQVGRVYTVTVTVSTKLTGSGLKVGLGSITVGANCILVPVNTDPGTYSYDITAASGALYFYAEMNSLTGALSSYSLKLKTEEYPQAADIVTIPSDCTVTYNVDSTDELGNLTVNGVLNFATNMSTQMRIANASTIAGTGTINIGSALSPLPKQYTCQIHLTCGTNATGGVLTTGTGNIQAYGDPEYYGSDFDTQLAADWTSGQTFNVVGDFSTKWAAGHILHIHQKNNSKFTGTTGHTVDVKPYTIGSVGAYAAGVTPITISDAAPGVTFDSGGYVLNVSRNVTFLKTGYDLKTGMGVAGALSPRFTCNAVSNFSAVTFMGFYRMAMATAGSSFNKCVFWRGQTAALYTSAAPASFSDNICATSQYMYNYTSTPHNNNYVYACASAPYGGPRWGGVVNNSKFFANYTDGISGAYRGKFVNCEFIANYGHAGILVYSRFVSCVFRGEADGYGIEGAIVEADFEDCWFYGSSYGFTLSTLARISGGGFGWTPGGVSSPNSVNELGRGGGMDPYAGTRLYGVKLPNSGSFTFVAANVSTSQGNRAVSINHGQVEGAVYIYHNLGDIIRNTSTVRPNGAGESLEIIASSAISGGYALTGLYSRMVVTEWTEDDVPAYKQQRAIYVMGTGWSANFPNKDELYLEAEYYDAKTHSCKRGIVRSVGVLEANSAWTKLYVEFCPTVASFVRYRICFRKYVASTKVYLDSALYNRELKRTIIWDDGHPGIDMHYDDWTNVSAIAVDV